jgi:dipeptidyl aminopeptidase/acylaminoacyl peptidase
VPSTFRRCAGGGKIAAMRRPALLSFALLAASLSAQQRLTPELLWQLGRLSEPRLAPDGRQLAYVVRSYDLAADSGNSQVLLHNLDSGVTVKLQLPGSNDNIIWSPDGNAVAVVSTRTGAPQIWLMRPDAGEPRQVTDQPGGVANASLSPTGEYFAFTADVKIDPDVHDRHADLPKASALLYDDLMVRHWNQWKDGTYSHLFVMPSNGGKAVDLMDGERADTPLKPFGGAEQIAWTPDGKELIYTAKKVPHPEVSTDSALYAVSVKGGATRCLTEGMPGFDQDPVCSPDGRFIAFGSMARGGFESDKMRVFLHDRREHKNRELLPDFDESVHGLQWAPDSKSLYGMVETKGTKQVCRITLDGKIAQLTKGRHELDDLQVGGNGTLVALQSTTERPAEIVKIDPESGSLTPVTDWNGRLFRNLDLPTVKEEWFPATDGKQILSFTVLPPGFDPQKKYPMLLYCQGGPQSMVGQWFSYRWNFHLMAAQGYVVAAVNRRGLPGFGSKWNDQISRDWGGQCMKDLLSVCDAMQERPYIDKARCAAVGASFGGYSVYWLMGNGGDRFACMIAHCGVFNLESMYLSTEELWFPNWDLGGPFWRSPEVQKDYERFSPHRFLQNWKTPLMVIHGGRDYRVPLEQGLQAFTAARVQGVPARLLVFPEECHWIMKPQDGVLWHREFFRWLDQYCKAPKEAVR